VAYAGLIVVVHCLPSFILKMADKFEALEQHLESFIETTRQLGIIVADFQPQGQSVLNQKL
jgi:hypothetical protein